MKWLDKIIQGVIDKVDVKINGIVETIEINTRNIDGIRGLTIHSLSDINVLKERIASLEQTISEVKVEQNKLRLEFFSKIDSLNIIFRNELELTATGLTKAFDNRLLTLGDKKGIVTDLLKKIAKLEGNNGSQS